MNCKNSRKQAKEYYEDNEDRYYEEKAEAFKDCILDQLKAYIESTDVEDLRIDDFSEEIEDDFNFPEIEDWLSSEYESALGDCADRAYEEYRDRQMED